MFDIVILIYKIVGIWIFYDPKNAKWYQFAYSISILMYLTAFIVMELLETRNTIRNIDEFVDQLSVLLTHLVGFIKLIVICWNRKEVLKIMDEFLDMKTYWFRFGEIYKVRLDNAQRTVQRVMTVFVSSAVVITIIMQMIPFLSIVLAEKDAFENDKNICNKLLSVYSTTIFPTTTKCFCLCAWLFQTIPVVIYCLAITAGDTTFFTYLMYLTANIKALQDNFKEIRTISERKLKILRYKNIFGHNDLFSSSKLRHAMDLEMKKCSKHLQWLFKIKDDVESIFNIIILIQMLCALFTLMSCMFIAATVDIFSSTFMLEAQLYFIFAFQISLYCIFGNEVEVAFSDLPTAIYSGSWYSTSSSFKKSMIISMIRLNKPIGLTAGKFSFISLSLLAKILRMSYSFFAVMKK